MPAWLLFKPGGATPVTCISSHSQFAESSRNSTDVGRLRGAWTLTRIHFGTRPQTQVVHAVHAIDMGAQAGSRL
jgi:hypothetical protein